MLAYILTFSRLGLAAAFAGLAALAGPGPVAGGWLAGLLAAALLAETTDMLDGWAARRAGTVSELGGLLDPLCDSLGRLTMYFAAGLAGWVWIGVPLVMAGRDIIVAYVRIAVGRRGGPTGARLSGKIKAIVQGVGIFAVVLLAGDGLGPAEASPATVAWGRALVAAAVVGATLASLVDYLRAGWPAVRAMAGAGRLDA